MDTTSPINLDDLTDDDLRSRLSAIQAKDAEFIRKAMAFERDASDIESAITVAAAALEAAQARQGAAMFRVTVGGELASLLDDAESTVRDAAKVLRSAESERMKLPALTAAAAAARAEATKSAPETQAIHAEIASRRRDQLIEKVKARHDAMAEAASAFADSYADLLAMREALTSARLGLEITDFDPQRVLGFLHQALQPSSIAIQRSLERNPV